ncbi:outer membrane protein [Pseudomonas sp. ABC1]|uniref:outer membrane protein n=1 Tax=Pseudomonas sp. ABC1 TaxID=2748080 RepID=UPI00211A0EF0|nr:outer membrane beta-barrel protein [Pseudomonas sp. ABC1]
MAPMALAGESGLYASVLGGANWVTAQDLRQNGLDFVEMNFEQPLESGYAVGLALGWRSTSGLRPELELSYRKNSLDRFENRVYEGGGKIDGKGTEAGSSLMANLWYDLPMPAALNMIRPYIGGGLGYTRLTLKNLSAGGVGFGATHRDDVQTWQLGAGAAMPVSDNWALSMDYRYLRTRQAHFGNIPGLPEGDVRTEYRAHSLMFGVQYAF